MDQHLLHVGLERGECREILEGNARDLVVCHDDEGEAAVGLLALQDELFVAATEGPCTVLHLAVIGRERGTSYPAFRVLRRGSQNLPRLLTDSQH